MYCVPYVARFSVFFVLCTLCCLVSLFFCRIVYPMLPVSLFFFVLCTLCSLTFICFSSYCVPYVASFSAVFFFVLPLSWFPNVYLSCVLCTLCCQFLCFFRIVYLRGSLTFICPVRIVYPMLPGSPQCFFCIALRGS